MSPRYQDRHDAGRVLSGMLSEYTGRRDLLVVALPRGGVPVGYAIATALGAPLDVIPVRKLGVPGNEELAFGAIAPGARVLNADVIADYGITDAVIASVTAAQEQELLRRERSYHGRWSIESPAGRAVIVVDDGLATGATMRAAIAALRQRGADPLIVAVPVGAPEVIATLQQDCNRIVCPLRPFGLIAVGAWYMDFRQIDDQEVIALLESAAGRARLRERVIGAAP